MPELPEVETVVRGLRAVLPGRRILTVRLGKTDFIEDPAALERDLPGSRITGVRRHGKFLVVELEASSGDTQNFSLLIHLGMTGQIVIRPPEAPVVPHTHVFFALDDGREFRYTDIRRFGKMRVLSAGTQAAALGKLGLDPLEATQAQFLAQLRGRRARIKALLLDQRVLRGMGNIYTDESLWRAKIHPMRLGVNLKDDELRRLHRAVQDILNEAIRMRGSSVSDYVDSEGRQGLFQQRHRVYQRKGKKCFRGDGVIRRVIVAGRSSYFCPRCQLAPCVPRRTSR
jgi:formamidopyrimidine-DNA glycosylase